MDQVAIVEAIVKALRPEDVARAAGINRVFRDEILRYFGIRKTRWEVEAYRRNYVLIGTANDGTEIHRSQSANEQWGNIRVAIDTLRRFGGRITTHRRAPAAAHVARIARQYEANCLVLSTEATAYVF